MTQINHDIIADLDSRIQWLGSAIAETQTLTWNIAVQQKQSNDWRINLDGSWMMTTAFLTFLIVIGFALVEGGFTRRKHKQSAIFNSAIVAAIVALFWWFTGYGFSFGGGKSKNRNGFIGNDAIFLSGHEKFPVQSFDDAFFFFAVTSVTTLIVSGAVAERLSNWAFMLHAALYSGFIWPVIAHWMYSNAGFFSPFADLPVLGKNGAIDTGFSAVHICGGAAAFAVLIFVGPRKGEVERFAKGNNRVFQTVGTFFQWAGWFGLTMGGVYHVASEYSDVTSRVAINITLAAGTASFHTFIWKILLDDEFDLTSAITGALAGLVSISASCGCVEPWAAMLIGAAGSAVYLIARRFLASRGYDDAVGAVSVHFFCGIWSILTVGIFATHADVVRLLRHETVAYGFLYGGSGNQFAVQLFAAFLMILWVFFVTVVWAVILNAIGFLRHDDKDEEETPAKTVDTINDTELTV
jgi:Amt family ammonium transporter